jgi:ATP-dependent DNA helicase Q1
VCLTFVAHSVTSQDYAQLGILKRHFPTVPLIAVTATASERVRADVCAILGLQEASTRMFRSTANRPNLRYKICPKSETKEGIVDDMTAWIQTNWPTDAGIVYTLSRKEADTVAAGLRAHGIPAGAYHSDVAPARKQRIHQEWMVNRLQVVVATIAFGLGINKPNVRFVLHHCISKNVDSYYQESGRAGRDGEPADCVLYYSPKVSRSLVGVTCWSAVSPFSRIHVFFCCRMCQECGPWYTTLQAGLKILCQW